MIILKDSEEGAYDRPIFFVPGIAHSSHLLGGTTSCAIVDPRRDTKIYLQAARDLNLRITHILQTHLHADFVSGHLDLVKSTGAAIVMPAATDAAFPHVPVKEGDTLRIDEIELNVLETPGHTPEHVTYVARDLARGREPVSIFCGDTLFVGDVAGRTSSRSRLSRWRTFFTKACTQRS